MEVRDEQLIRRTVPVLDIVLNQGSLRRSARSVRLHGVIISLVLHRPLAGVVSQRRDEIIKRQQMQRRKVIPDDERPAFEPVHLIQARVLEVHLENVEFDDVVRS